MLEKHDIWHEGNMCMTWIKSSAAKHVSTKQEKTVTIYMLPPSPPPSSNISKTKFYE